MTISDYFISRFIELHDKRTKIKMRKVRKGTNRKAGSLLNLCKLHVFNRTLPQKNTT